MVKNFVLLIVSVLFLAMPVLAEAGAIDVIGKTSDSLGNSAILTTIELGRDRYLGIGLEVPGQEQGANQIILKNEVPRLLKMLKQGARASDSLKTGEIKILDGFEGGDEGLAIIRANLDGKNTLTILQVTEKGRERQFLLNSKTWPALEKLIKKAEKKL